MSEYPACDPVVDVGHPKCFGTLLPVERLDIRHMRTKPPMIPMEKIWKCSVCGREVQ